jgi:hypothetical protein
VRSSDDRTPRRIREKVSFSLGAAGADQARRSCQTAHAEQETKRMRAAPVQLPGVTSQQESEGNVDVSQVCDDDRRPEREGWPRTETARER